MHPSYFQLGPLRLPWFGVVAAVGLIAALGLSQRTARLRGLDASKLWDAGLAAVILAFAVSRALLVAFNLHDFLLYPLLLLAVPSLTTTGVLVTAVSVVVYLRRKRMPVLAVMDAWAPCAALLWAFVSVGRLIEGTRDGMPTALPWGVRVFGSATDRVHPVEAYTAFAAAALCGVLLGFLRRRGYTGETAAAGLVLAGGLSFFLDFFRIPSEVFLSSWLDPVEVGSLMLIVLGGFLFLSRTSRRKQGLESDPRPAEVD